MARIEYVEHRLLNWARWRESTGSGVLGYSAIRLGADGVGNREAYREARIPISDCDAAETDAAVAALPAELNKTVIETYTGRGTQAELLGVLGIGLTTYKGRITLAHQKLASYFTERQRAREAERSRVDVLQRGGFYT